MTDREVGKATGVGARGAMGGRRVGIVGCGLIGRKRAEVLGEDELVGVLRPRRRR